ncbi:hypothetical protein GCM10010967_33420 [Dyadobacter beijingensis]|uniref:DUF4374 domain-containing protein n=1 Tax=Dyadobacter beijingensis TaxID=365489 RepID=A0ABQ2I320_9BACT|nr:DUF4374 domain-containing protein [Dyadobacter beijingensis]GGM96944.1 hypothetical protein GCM10010967_33420 [Dyadobacter beijingensis]
MFKLRKLLFGAVLLALGSVSCSDNDEKDIVNPEPEAASFAIWAQLGSWPNTNYYIMNVASLSEGAVKLEGNGVDVTTLLNNSVISKGRFYYYYNTTEGKFGKYKIENGAVSVVKEFPFTQFLSLAGHTWIDDNTLVMIGGVTGAKAVNYVIVNTNAMTITKAGTVSGLPAAPETHPLYRVGGDIQYKDGKLFFSVINYNGSDFTLFKRLNTLAVSYPDFAVTKVSTDTRTAGLGNTSGYFTTSFVDQAGDMYFLTSWNGISGGVNTKKSIYRIKKGSDELDPTYYMDVQAEIGFTPASGVLMDLGNGKAIIKYMTTDNSTTAKNKFAIINIATGKEFRKLDEVPEGLGSERNVFVENGKAYIASLSGQGTDYIWIYDSATDKVTKGLELQGGYTSFSRIDKLK